jgi:hypothetical protein
LTRPAPSARKSRATTTAAASFLLALGATRLVRVLQINGRLPGGGGLSIGGHHIHHFVWGLGLVAVQGAAGVTWAIPIDDRRRALPLGAGLALAADEFDIILGVEHWRLAQQDRPLADLALASCAAALGVAGKRSLARNRTSVAAALLDVSMT